MIATGVPFDTKIGSGGYPPSSCSCRSEMMCGLPLMACTGADDPSELFVCGVLPFVSTARVVAVTRGGTSVKLAEEVEARLLVLISATLPMVIRAGVPPGDNAESGHSWLYSAS